MCINSKRFCEERRIIVARKLKVPPDDIDLEAIYECYFKALRKSKINKTDFICLNPENERETKSVVSYNGSKILGDIFCQEEPFDIWLEYRLQENWEDRKIFSEIE